MVLIVLTVWAMDGAGLTPDGLVRVIFKGDIPTTHSTRSQVVPIH